VLRQILPQEARFGRCLTSPVADEDIVSILSHGRIRHFTGLDETLSRARPAPHCGESLTGNAELR
jgi:hypothetical protein